MTPLLHRTGVASRLLMSALVLEGKIGRRDRVKVELNLRFFHAAPLPDQPFLRQVRWD